VSEGGLELTSLASTWDIEDEPKQLADLHQDSRPNIASGSFYPRRRYRANVLALSRRHLLETVRIVDIDLDLRGETSQRRSKGHNLHNTRICVQDRLRRHNDSRMSKPSFSSRRSAKIQLDDITRGQHRANQPLRRSNPEQDQPRSDPDEADEPQAQRYRPRSHPKRQRAA
jgi:hypothetical protein